MSPHESRATLSDSMRDWALRQPMFFVASAPLRGRHVNLSPKGLPESSLAVINSGQVAYIDSIGTGCETIAHVRENGRVTLLFCSFDKVPRILRLYCAGTVVEIDVPEYAIWLKKLGEKKLVAARAIIVLDIFKAQLSCGFGVPYLGLDPDAAAKEPTPRLLTRPRLDQFGQYTVDRGQLQDYKKRHNTRSLDGLPGLHCALRDSGQSVWWAECQNWHCRHQPTIERVQMGIILGLLLLLAL
ncbi:FMN-binding split barrel [Cordyceps fumosorosea ARSEF 2679]|uniref:FMN-binding split barrel n=1 Tax=Cordyceps fumosorosea (strain ARSEF 2679) TaxID=1081104 RepID=A0A162JR50_CORFA|nr:FMN-binding split barrel [Cordyceps fumosorosea ARSEF 2679]OAA72572.1 FMN-binding split barrel [Cordyceps fumosorosea ARSEF 2679]